MIKKNEEFKYVLSLTLWIYNNEVRPSSSLYVYSDTQTVTEKLTFLESVTVVTIILCITKSCK